MADLSLEQARSIVFNPDWTEDHDLKDMVDRAECAILDHRPRTPSEALLVLDVLALNVSAGERSDSRDVGAIENLKAWVSELMSETDLGQGAIRALAG